MGKYFKLMMAGKTVKLSEKGLNFWSKDEYERTRNELSEMNWYILKVGIDEMELCSETHTIFGGVTLDQVQ